MTHRGPNIQHLGLQNSPGNFPQTPRFSRIPCLRIPRVRRFPISEGNKQDIWSPPTGISGKLGNFYKVTGVLQPYQYLTGSVTSSTAVSCNTLTDSKTIEVLMNVTMMRTYIWNMLRLLNYYYTVVLWELPDANLFVLLSQLLVTH